MRVIVIDDEYLARQSIINILNNKFPAAELVGEAESVKEAIEQIKTQKPDLIFLDIDLTDGTGFDLLNTLGEISFKIIFVTAHNDFAIKAIKFSALDYLLKPIDSFELQSALLRAQKDLNTNSEKEKVETFFHNIAPNNTDKKIVLRTAEKMFILPVSEIIRCESKSNYTYFMLEGGKQILVSKNIKEYQKILEEHGFMRVHRSHLININKISCFEKKDGGYLILSDKNKIPVAQRQKNELLKIMVQKYKVI